LRFGGKTARGTKGAAMVADGVGAIGRALCTCFHRRNLEEGGESVMVIVEQCK